jgi:hypothetical protein
VTRPLAVLGMMRSGTSAVAGVLDALGVSFGPPDRWLEPNDANPTGFREHKGIIALNDELLARLGGTWFALPDPTPGWETDRALEDLRVRARSIIARDLATSEYWAWKDPRTSLTLPFWHGLVPTVAHVICVRNPIEAARSLAALEWAQKRIGDPHRVGLDLWLRFTSSALEHTLGRRRLVVFFDDLLANPLGEADRLAAFAGLASDVTRDQRRAIGDFVRAPFKHQLADEPSRMDELRHPALELYAELERARDV